MDVSATLQEWIDEERSILDKVNAGRGPGVANLTDLDGKSGLAVMEDMLDGKVPYAEMSRTLSFGAIEVGEGEAIFQGWPQRQYLNPMGTIHGGWISTVLDSAMGSAVLTLLPPGQGYLTTSLSVKYVKALTLRVSRVRAEAVAKRSDEKTASAESKLVGPDGAVYAHASAVCRILEIPKL